ncbi:MULTISPECIES: sensor histidine kinase KdpD [Microbacterium]|uniref:sensor histidine kinase n=1 Tax=Microbacterium TaxID=33882 RepID=UPI0027815EE4|nr:MULTISPECIES: HAMP domain-containing sensor histidine kinase [Microbacterium]MDQ1084098.1 signal transduction histidine kinase [Microbacterium sp. SORGH_AS_0344]MDQ1170626.1 signal transduction histidine kinase [Microbacterium proteolyticum]
MRLRVLLPLLVFGLIAVIAVLIPAAQSIADSRTQQIALQRTAALDHVVQRARTALVQDDGDGLQGYVERFHAVYGESVLVLDADGDAVASAGDLLRDARVDELVTAASRALPQLSLPRVSPWGPSTSLVAVPVIAAGDLSAGVVVLAVDLRDGQADVSRAWAVIVMVGVLLLSALMAASVLWTRWILRPVRALDAAVADVTAHRDPPPLRPSGPPELRHLSRAFVAMADEVETSLEQQRGFVADASHQLRTPLAAIRLRVDALARDGETADDLAAVDDDLDRLEYTVNRMLTLANAEHRASAQSQGRDDARDEGAPRECTVTAAELAARHQDRLRSAGQTLVAVPGAAVTIPCGRADLDEMVDVLLDNAAKYAGPAAEVRVTLAQDATGIRLLVEDSGTRLTDRDLAHMGTRFWRAGREATPSGTGLGLAIVAQLMRAAGGRLDLARSALGGLAARLVWERP